MRLSLMLALAMILIPAAASAQPNMDEFDQIGYLQPDGYRIFFDASVPWTYEGILESPVLEFTQTVIMVEAWLVLVEPTAASLGGYRFGRELAGSHVLLQEEFLGSPVTLDIMDEIVAVDFEPPLPMNGTAVPLVRWYLLNSFFAPVEFYLWPAPGDETPVYLDGEDDPVAANTFNGRYHGYAAPVAILNGGVTPIRTTAWGEVKALFR